MAHSALVNHLTANVKTMTEVQAKATLMVLIRTFGILENRALRLDLLTMTMAAMAEVIEQTKET